MCEPCLHCVCRKSYLENGIQSLHSAKNGLCGCAICARLPRMYSIYRLPACPPHFETHFENYLKCSAADRIAFTEIVTFSTYSARSLQPRRMRRTIALIAFDRNWNFNLCASDDDEDGDKSAREARRCIPNHCQLAAITRYSASRWQLRKCKWRGMCVMCLIVGGKRYMCHVMPPLPPRVMQFAYELYERNETIQMNGWQRIAWKERKTQRDKWLCSKHFHRFNCSEQTANAHTSVVNIEDVPRVFRKAHAHETRQNDTRECCNQPNCLTAIVLCQTCGANSSHIGIAHSSRMSAIAARLVHGARLNGGYN